MTEIDIQERAVLLAALHLGRVRFLRVSIEPDTGGIVHLTGEERLYEQHAVQLLDAAIHRLFVLMSLHESEVRTNSLTPMVGAEGGAGCPVVVQAEPGPAVGGSPARASLEAPPDGWREVEPMVLLTQRGLTLTRVTLREGEPAAEYNVGDGWKPTPAEYAPGAWLVRKRDSGVISPAKASDESEAST